MTSLDLSSGALAPYRIIDLTGERGAMCGKLLAELGAEVIKVEPPGGEASRRLGPFKDGVPHLEGSLRFASLNVNKKGVTIDQATSDGRQLLEALLASADAVIEDCDPGQQAARGLAPNTFAAAYPSLVHTSITGFGLDGPNRDFGSTDLVALAMGGILNLSGDPTLPPCAAPETQAWYVACIHAAFATVVALYARAFTGCGQLVEIAAQDCLMVEEHHVSRYGQDGHVVGREGSRHGGAAPGSVYPVQDGFAHIFVATTWPDFLQWMGSPEPLTAEAWNGGAFRRANVDVLDPYVREFARGWKRDELAEAGQRRHTPVMPVNRPEDVADDPHLHSLGFFYGAAHPYLGEARYAGSPARMSATPPRFERAAPLLGEHNLEVFGALGYSPDDLAGLKAAAAI